MRVEKISYEQTNFFSKFILDYLSGDERLTSFYHRAPKLSSFKAQLEDKQKQKVNRSVLVNALNEQYSDVKTSDLVVRNIQSIQEENTFTVTTGHQLCLFTGPLYFIYKIVTTINLAEQLKREYPNFNFVPIYWMASEDHDFEEINHVNLFGSKLAWDQPQQGAVGVMPTHSLTSVLDKLRTILGTSEEAEALYALFSDSYMGNPDLTSATRCMVNSLFSRFGLVVLDAGAVSLKRQAVSLIKNDLLEQRNYPLIQKVNKELGKAQAFVRPINFFYLQEGSRNRIEKDGESFVVLNSVLRFTREELEFEIENYPERFSPNVLLRPLFKELLLPNLAMIGGGAEVNYWMQLKSTFEANKITFPILLLRNSALVVNSSQIQKIQKTGFSVIDFFSTEEELHKRFIELNKEGDIGVENEKNQIEVIFDSLAKRIQDSSLQASIFAEKKKQLKSLSKMEQKLRKSEKSKHQNSLTQISKLKGKLFPNNTLQERYDNIIPMYLNFGPSFIDEIKEAFDPFEQKFTLFIDD